MAVRQYVGARYVPKFSDSVEWQHGTSYEALTIVTYNSSSYTSKIPVPATVGDPADNPEFWALTGNYNAQVELYRKETEDAIATANEAKNTANTNRSDIENIKRLGTDFYNLLSPIASSVTITTPESANIQGFCIIDGTGYVAMIISNESRVYRYPNILTSGEYDSFVILTGCVHPNSINNYGNYLYISDSSTPSNIHIVELTNFTYVGLTAISGASVSNSVICSYGDGLYLMGEDITNQSLDIKRITIGENGSIADPSDFNFRGYVPTNYHFNYTQGICELPNHEIVIIRSIFQYGNQAYLMLINPKEDAQCACVPLPNNVEYEDISVYNNNLYIIGSNATIYNLGNIQRYYMQLAGTNIEGMELRGIRYKFSADLNSLPYTIAVGSGHTNFFRPRQYFDCAKFSLSFRYEGYHNDITISGLLNDPQRNHYSGEGIRNDYTSLMTLYVDSNSNNISFTFGGAVINGSHYTTISDITPAHEQPNGYTLIITN